MSDGSLHTIRLGSERGSNVAIIRTHTFCCLLNTASCFFRSSATAFFTRLCWAFLLFSFNLYLASVFFFSLRLFAHFVFKIFLSCRERSHPACTQRVARLHCGPWVDGRKCEEWEDRFALTTRDFEGKLFMFNPNHHACLLLKINIRVDFIIVQQHRTAPHGVAFCTGKEKQNRTTAHLPQYFGRSRRLVCWGIVFKRDRLRRTWHE